jgi:hypothetical protein
MADSNILYEHDWKFFVGTDMYGLDQYSYWVDSDSVTIISPELAHLHAGTWRTYTRIYLGNRGISVRAHAWSIVALGIAGLGLGLWTTSVAVNAFTGRRLVPDKDSTPKAE